MRYDIGSLETSFKRIYNRFEQNVNAPYLRLHVHASMDIRVRARLLIKPKTLYTIV